MKRKINRCMKKLRKYIGSKSIHAFARMYLPNHLSCKAPRFHKELYKLLFDIAHKRNEHIAMAAPRGSAKSSIVSLIYVIWCIAYSKEKYIVLISDTSSQAEDLLTAIKKELETNKLLIRDFPEICEIGQKPRPPRWKKNEIITRNNIKILTLGATQKIRGRKHNESRPTLIILDDIENDESTQSIEQRDKLFDWFTKALMKAGTLETNILVIGTIQHYDSLLAKLTSEEEMPGWYKKVYRSVISWSTTPWRWERWKGIYNNKGTYEDKRGPKAAKKYFLANKEKMLENTEVLWPEKEDYYSLMVIREQGGDVSFNSEKQNEPIDPKTSLFNAGVNHYWDDEFNSEDELLRALGDDIEIYGACDPSLGKIGKSGDFSAIITLVRHTKTGNIYVLDADIERRTPDLLIETITAYCRKRRYRKFAIESNQFQDYLIDEIEKRLKAEGLYVEIVRVNHTSNKIGRVQSLQPFVKNGTIRFSKRHRTLIEQLMYFPKGAHDDGPDALEMAFRICYKNPENDYDWFDASPHDEDDDF